MKKILGISLLVLFLIFSATGAFAQLPNNKRFEFSASASMASYYYDVDKSEKYSWLNIPLRIGFFIYKGLEIEPELFLTIPTGGTQYMGILVMGNVSYNFKSLKKLVPFILGGAGVGNGPQTLYYVSDWGRTFTAFNFGAGIKWLVGDSAAIRIEYRFIRYLDEYDYNDRTDNRLYFGVSIFF